MKALTVIKAISFGLLALFLGLFELIFLFADLGPGETLLHRYSVIIVFNLVSGLIIGLANSRAWFIAGIVSWAGVVVALRALFGGPSQWLEMATVAALSPLPAFAGGYLGAQAIKQKVFRYLFRRKRQS